MERQRIGLLFQLFRTEQVSRRLVGHALDGTELRGDDFAVYSYLRAGPMTLTELADGVGMPLTTAAGYVKRLEERGHVERVPNPADGRSTLIELSAAGLEVHGEVAHQFGTELKRFNDILRLEGVDAGHLTDQLQLFQRLMERTLEELE